MAAQLRRVPAASEYSSPGACERTSAYSARDSQVPANHGELARRGCLNAALRLHIAFFWPRDSAVLTILI